MFLAIKFNSINSSFSPTVSFSTFLPIYTFNFFNCSVCCLLRYKHFFAPMHPTDNIVFYSEPPSIGVYINMKELFMLNCKFVILKLCWPSRIKQKFFLSFIFPGCKTDICTSKAKYVFTIPAQFAYLICAVILNRHPVHLVFQVRGMLRYEWFTVTLVWRLTNRKWENEET